MKNNKVFFVGDRFHVFEKILKLDLELVAIYVVENSYLEKELKARKIKHFILSEKNILIERVKSTDFTYFISNGCPYILPISQIKKTDQIFINIHPSLLPDLKGMHPINGSILFNRKAGATCHLMDDNIDNGKIISQVKIGNTKDLDLGLLYQLSFIAEAEAFEQAYLRNFRPIKSVKSLKNTKYYTRTDSDLIINFSEESRKIIKQIKSFAVPSQGAYFLMNGKKFKVMDAEVVKNNYLLSKISLFKDLEIVFIYDNNLIIRKNSIFLKLKNVIGDFKILQKGDILK